MRLSVSPSARGNRMTSVRTLEVEGVIKEGKRGDLGNKEKGKKAKRKLWASRFRS